MTKRIADIAIPDSVLARDATTFIRDAAGELLYHHSRRVFLFGTAHGHRHSLKADPELLYVAALFHDLGLTPQYRTDDRRFEIDGAEQARAFLLGHGANESDMRVVWTAIALHTTPGIPAYMEPEIALVTAGVELDVLGIGYEGLPANARAQIVAAHPRPDFKNRIIEAFAEGIAHKPQTTFGNIKADVLAHCTPGYVRPDFVEMIRASPWPE